MRRSTLTTVLAVTLLVPGCRGGDAGNGGGDTYIRFETNGQAFSVDGAELDVHEMDQYPGRYNVSLDGTDLGANPSAHLTFHMFLDQPTAIAGQTVDMSRVPKDVRGPLLSFDLDDDVTVVGLMDSGFTIYFRDIQDGIIAGTFSGQNLVVNDANDTDIDSPMTRTSVSGSFRARVVER